MDDEELALFFSARKENEELKEQLISLKKRYDRTLFFIKLLNKYPRFWGKTYKKYIKKWLIRHEKEFPDK